MSTISKKYLNIILSGLENEYYGNKLILNQYYPELLKYLSHIPPRSLRLLTYFKNHLWIFNLLLTILNIFWWLIFYPLFVMIQLIEAIYLKFRKFKFRHFILEKGEIIAILFSSRHKKAIERVLKKVERKKNIKWIGFKHCNNQNVLRIEEMVTFLDLFKIFFTVLILPIKNQKILAVEEKKNPGFKLQFFDIFQCYLYANWLDNNQKNLKDVYICNLGDRWATITTELLTSARLHLIQHGILREFLKPPKKLKNIFALYVFDKESRRIYSNNFLQKKPSRVHFFPPVIQLKEKTAFLNSYKGSILLIGEPYCIEKEHLIIKYILDNYPFYFLYIKPHPSFSLHFYDKYKKLLNVKIIKEIDFFPKVEVAITSFSTLGLEYKICGQKVLFFHNMKTPELLKEIDKILSPKLDK